ncbi:hypothetical protein [Bradyrhizobium diazoefficiens]|uniref:hypothetical protein n=1 Tax=Bradyrhizobium diazoefficiens TaxID=1355477 RepID=UPI00272D170F|nr:hypothetical protein [Bradyrhizobium diazoefficiens]WLA65831.1 hypothetical protein QNN01_02790 [Bradyrhizobium diazoefficiens]
MADVVEPPRSWGKEEKQRFLQLPRDLQLYFAKREQQRDDTVRRAQNEAAQARREMKELQAKLAASEERLAKIEEKNAETRDVAA